MLFVQPRISQRRGPPDAANVTVESSAHYDPPRTTSISQPERGSSFSARRPRQAMFVAGR